MSGNLAEGNVAGHPESVAYLVARRSDGTFAMVQGVDAGDYVSIGGESQALRMAKEEQAVVNNTTVNFEITLDIDGNALPAKMDIKGIIVVPHNGAATPVAVSTKWRLQIFTHSDRLIDEIIVDEDRTGIAASSARWIDTTKRSFLNEEGNGALLCSLTIPNSENDATFTVKVIFA